MKEMKTDAEGGRKKIIEWQEERSSKEGLKAGKDKRMIW